MDCIRCIRLIGLLTLLVSLLSGCIQTRGLSYEPSTLARDNYNKKAQLAGLSKAISKYQSLTSQPWPPIYPGSDLNPGDKSSEVPKIRHRLALLGDLLQSNSVNGSMVYDSTLANAVRHFKRRHGLVDDGIIDTETLKALNITPSQRVAQLKRNRQRWSQLPSNGTYVHVNIPSYELNIMENTHSMVHMKVIVGRPDWPTPIMNATIETIVLNPKWNIPVSITEADIIEKVVNNPNYLEDNNIEVKTGWHDNAREINPDTINWQKYLGAKQLPYRLTQQSGESNVLGDMKFRFPNANSIYLHDTPNKRPFQFQERAVSHGCIRLRQPYELLRFIISRSPDITMSEVYSDLDSGKTKYIAVEPYMPIYITYITTWTDSLGNVQFRQDIYNKDSV